MNSHVGLIGLGLVGNALALRFRNAGFTVHGHDIADEARKAFADRGGIVHASPIEVTRACRRVVLSLPTSEVAGQVIAEIESGLLPGDIVLDTTTGEPDAMAQIGQALRQHGVHYLDACIAGSSQQVSTGEVTLLIGGDAAAVAACSDLTASFGRHVFHLGPCGSGARMKLVVNLVLGLNRAVLAEGLMFAQACGIEPSAALEVLKAGPAFSRVMETKGPKMLARDFSPQARLHQHLKDVRLILAEAERLGAHTPLSDLHRALLETLDANGFGSEDNAAILRAFEN